MVNLENEAVQARQRQDSAEQALAAAQQRPSSYPQEAVHLHRQLESSTRAHWASRRRSLVIHVQGVCV